jgi:hypothetical protein
MPTVRAFYYEPEPGGSYVEPFPVAYYFDFPHTMTVLQSDDPRVVDFIKGGGKIASYEPPVKQEEAPPRDFASEFDALKAALIEKAVVTEADVVAKVGAVVAPSKG